MTTIMLQLPDSLHKEIEELTVTEGISITQFLLLAAAEKMSALRTVDYLRAEDEKGNRVLPDYKFLGKQCTPEKCVEHCSYRVIFTV